MAKVTFEIEIESAEVPQALNMLRDIVEAFAFPEYEMSHSEDGNRIAQIRGAKRAVGNLPPVQELTFQELAKFAEAVGLPGYDEWEDETDPCIILPGGVVELDNGLVYQVFSIDATGRVILDVLEELDNEDDSFLCGPRLH